MSDTNKKLSLKEKVIQKIKSYFKPLIIICFIIISFLLAKWITAIGFPVLGASYLLYPGFGDDGIEWKRIMYFFNNNDIYKDKEFIEIPDPKNPLKDAKIYLTPLNSLKGIIGGILQMVQCAFVLPFFLSTTILRELLFSWRGYLIIIGSTLMGFLTGSQGLGYSGLAMIIFGILFKILGRIFLGKYSPYDVMSINQKALTIALQKDTFLNPIKNYEGKMNISNPEASSSYVKIKSRKPEISSLNYVAGFFSYFLFYAGTDKLIYNNIYWFLGRDENKKRSKVLEGLLLLLVGGAVSSLISALNNSNIISSIIGSIFAFLLISIFVFPSVKEKMSKLSLNLYYLFIINAIFTSILSVIFKKNSGVNFALVIILLGLSIIIIIKGKLLGDISFGDLFYNNGIITAMGRMCNTEPENIKKYSQKLKNYIKQYYELYPTTMTEANADILKNKSKEINVQEGGKSPRNIIRELKNEFNKVSNENIDKLEKLADNYNVERDVHKIQKQLNKEQKFIEKQKKSIEQKRIEIKKEEEEREKQLNAIVSKLEKTENNTRKPKESNEGNNRGNNNRNTNESSYVTNNGNTGKNNGNTKRNIKEKNKGNIGNTENNTKKNKGNTNENNTKKTRKTKENSLNTKEKNEVEFAVA